MKKLLFLFQAVISEEMLDLDLIKLNTQIISDANKITSESEINITSDPLQYLWSIRPFQPLLSIKYSLSYITLLTNADVILLLCFNFAIISDVLSIAIKNELLPCTIITSLIIFYKMQFNIQFVRYYSYSKSQKIALPNESFNHTIFKIHETIFSILYIGILLINIIIWTAILFPNMLELIIAYTIYNICHIIINKIKDISN